MRTMRRILGDRLTAGGLAAIVAYVVLLQGLTSAYAQGTLAGPQPGSTFVICSLTGAIPGTQGSTGDSPLERAAHQCCAALCHVAASHSPILPTADIGLALVAQVETQAHFTIRYVPPRSSVPGLLPQPRAPIHLHLTLN